MRDVKLSLPLIEVMKFVRLTSSLPDMPHLSSPKPRLRHGRRLACLSLQNLTLNPCTLSFILSLALLHYLFHPLISPIVPLPGSRLFADYLRFHYSVSQQKALRSRSRSYLSELCRATCPEESPLSFCSPFSPAEFLAAATNLSSPTATGPEKVAYSMLKHLPSSGMDFLQNIFNLSWSLHSFHLEDIFNHSNP